MLIDLGGKACESKKFSFEFGFISDVVPSLRPLGSFNRGFRDGSVLYVFVECGLA